MSRPMVYVCSPLEAATASEMWRNMHNARRLMAEIAAETKKRAVAPQAFLPEFLDAFDPEERTLARKISTMLLGHCESLVVCGEAGKRMQSEIRQAGALGIPVIWRVSRNIYQEYPGVQSEQIRKGA